MGYVADTMDAAAEEFFPGYRYIFSTIGRERGWSPVNRAQFDAVRGPTGAMLIGDAETVAEKILRIHRALGGVSRVNFQMSPGILPHARELHAIELLGTRVAPLVREALEPATPGLQRAA